MDKKIIIQSPFGDDNQAVIVGVSENETPAQLRSDFVRTAKEFGDVVNKIVTHGTDLISVVEDNTRYETFNKELILKLEDEMAKPFPQYKK